MKEISASIEGLLEELQTAYLDIDSHLSKLNADYAYRARIIKDERKKRNNTDVDDPEQQYRYTVDIKMSDQQTKLAKTINEAHANKINLLKLHESIIRRTQEGKIDNGVTSSQSETMTDSDFEKLRALVNKEIDNAN